MTTAIIKKENLSIKFWEDVSTKNWNETTHPWRPHLLELLFYSYKLLVYKLLKNNDDIVLLIGATKELRVLLNSMKLSYDIIDYSKNMLHLTKPAYDKYLRHEINSTWNNIKKGKTSYQLIIGDLVLNLLGEAEIKDFSNYVYSSTKSNGQVILRTRTLSQEKISTLETLFFNQFNLISEKTKYVCFANYQTLIKRNSSEINKYIELQLLTKNNPLQRQFKKKFMSGPLEYFLYTKKNYVYFFNKKWRVSFFQFYKMTNTIFDDFSFTILKKFS